MKRANERIEAVEEHAYSATGGVLGSPNFLAVVLAAAVASLGVLALQSLAAFNHHAGSRADTMSLTWCAFVLAMLLSTLLKRPE